MLNYIFKGDTRSVKAEKNIIVSAVIKCLDTLIYFLLVPLTLGYLNPYEYGIWLTLNSILMWIYSLDIGLGNGLRNKLGFALAEGNLEKGRNYVSTTFFMLLFLTFFIFSGVSVVIDFIDWNSLLNVKENSVGNLKEIVFSSFLFFCLNFIFGFIGSVYQALQLPAVNYLISFSGRLLSLVIIYIMTLTTKGSLLGVAVAYSAAPPLVYILCYPITFKKLYPSLSPSLKFFKKDYLKDLLSLSIVFFIIQIMGIVLFSLSNILISRMFGPDQVTPYNLAYRYFSVLPIVFNLVLSPLWSASTDAYARGDLQWIKNSLNRVTGMLSISAFVISVMVIFSSFFYKIWIGSEVEISLKMTIFMGIYFFILVWSLSYSSILNGMGKLRLQTINIVCVAMFFYPICKLLGGNYGTEGVVLGMCLVNIPGALLNKVQLKKILNLQASGIWFK